MRVAIITGASRGIGAGLVASFGGACYAVVGNSRSMSSLEEPDYLTVQGDIAKAETARSVVYRALDRFGRIDSLINNAGQSAATDRPASGPAERRGVPCVS
jgi:NAD(P)-dependent dehydrogenase (short-subunit alcohol dehydrogenase family)